MARYDTLPTAWADLGYNGKSYVTSTRSGFRSSAIDKNGLYRFVAPDASSRELGEALLDVLGASRVVPESEFSDFFDWRKVDERVKKWCEVQCEYFDVKSIQTVNKNMMRCGVEVRDGILYLDSWIHVAASEWKDFTDQDAHTTSLPYNSPPEAIGAAIRTAIQLCDGNGRMSLKFPEPLPD